MPLPSPTQPRRLTHCPSCGYTLEGLPGESTCPECGQSYDQSAYILYAEARGHHASLTTSNSAGAIFQGLAFLFILLIILLQFRRPHRLQPIDYAVYGAFLLALASILIKRLTADRPGLVRIWVTPHGCAQEDDLAPNSLLDAFTRYAPVLLWLMILFWAFQYPQQRPTFLWLIAPAVLATLLNRRYTGRFFWSAPPPGPPQVTPWSDIATLAITHEEADRYRVRVIPIRSFWDLRKKFDVIDAAITCPRPQAERLAADAHLWHHNARTPT